MCAAFITHLGIERIFKMIRMTKSRANLIDGFVFLTAAICLFAYSIISYNADFNKDWAQSPYLFPLIVSIMIGFLSVSLILQTMRQSKIQTAIEEVAAHKKMNLKGVAIVFAIISIYYLVLTVVKIPIVTIMIYSLAITFSIFEAATILLLVVLMWYLGVRKASILVLTPVLSTLFISIAFRTLLHVLLP